MLRLLRNFVLGLVMVLAVAITPSVVSANEYVPDTDLISSETEYIIVNEGLSDGATPMWVSHNPSCYTKQELKTGTWEAWIDTETQVVHVWKNGVEVRTIKL